MSETPRGPLRPGARVGAFVVREEIGRGGTSVVYEAEHRTLRHRVAVKVLRSASEMDGELRLRFEREMRLCSTLTSMHVPHVYEVGELPSGLPYIVMERLSGTTIADWLSLHRRLPVAVVVEIGIQLCAALSALHERDVLHRDVKPENLLLHHAFSYGYVLKLVDFGICKPLLEPSPAITRTGTVVGTPEYMSPEQVQGLDVDARTDVYSTGIVLYELLAGRTPFEGCDLDVIGRAILFANPPRLSAVRNEVSAVLEGIVMRAMARDRKNRHPTIGALRRELERFADEHALRRHPHVWGLLPSDGARALPPPPPASGRREPMSPTLVTPRLPMRRTGIVGTAVAGLAVLLGAVGSVAYYVYEPKIAGAIDAAKASVPSSTRVRIPAPPAPATLDLTPLLTHEEPAPESATPTAAPAPSEPARAGSPRRRVQHRPRPAHRASRDAQGPPATTVAFAPTLSLSAASTSNLSAAEIYAQVAPVEPNEVEPSEPAETTSLSEIPDPPPDVEQRTMPNEMLDPPYVEEESSIPRNPF